MIWCCGLSVSLAATGVILFSAHAATPTYPEARREHQVDEFFGIEIEDPYRWLEDVGSEQARGWIRAQRALTESYFEQIDSGSRLRTRFAELDRQEIRGIPVERNGTYYYRQGRSLYRRLPGQDPDLLVDGRQLDALDASILVDYWVSADGRSVAYTISPSGSDWRQIRVLDSDGKEREVERIDDVIQEPVVWFDRDGGFVYSRRSRETRMPETWFHRLGTKPESDSPVFPEGSALTHARVSRLTEEGRFLLFWIHANSFRDVEFYCRDLAEGGHGIVRLFSTREGDHHFVCNYGSQFIFHTTSGAPNGRVIQVDVRRPDPKHWQELLPEVGNPIDHVRMAGDRMIVVYIADDLRHVVQVFDPDGAYVSVPELPEAQWYAFSERCGRSDRHVYFQARFYDKPPEIFRLDMGSLRSDRLHAPEPVVGSDPLVMSRTSCKSEDGTEIPLFLVHRGTSRRWVPPPSSMSTGATGCRTSRNTAGSSCLGWRWAACWRLVAFGAAANEARLGTRRGAGRTRSTRCETFWPPRAT